MISRRDFIGRATAAGAALGFPAIVRAQNLNSRLRHACIGTGGKGQDDWQRFMSHEKIDIVAGCDVDLAHTRAFKAKIPGARDLCYNFPSF